MSRDSEREQSLRASVRALDLYQNQGLYQADTPQGAPAVLARTTSVSRYPTTVNAYYAMQRLDLLGAEVEGGTGTITAGSPVFFAMNLGSTIPPSAAQVLCTYVGNRWVFRYDA